jgi:O-antigen/teichoic acid export membrane protein
MKKNNRLPEAQRVEKEFYRKLRSKNHFLTFTICSFIFGFCLFFYGLYLCMGYSERVTVLISLGFSLVCLGIGQYNRWYEQGAVIFKKQHPDMAKILEEENDD